jgi:DNA-binding NtrC family response regulator
LVDATVAAKNRVEVRGGRIREAKRSTWIEVGTEPVVVGRNIACQIVIDDAKVSLLHAEFIATEQGVRVRDLGSKTGTFVGGARVSEVCLTAKSKLKLGETELVFEPRKPEHIKVLAISAFGPLVGQSAVMRSIFDKLGKIAAADQTILVSGEAGTGKTLLAKAVHAASPRAKKPFVVVDCGSIPPAFAEAVLFGNERGASGGGAEKRPSPFQQAEGGTLFLSELGELPLEVQPKLLRALAERRIKAVGGSAYREINVRVVAGTRRDLARAVNAGTFRSDLYFRVAEVKIDIAPLRDRPEDVPGLVRRMLKDLGDESAFERVAQSTLGRLMRHDWPGNARELGSAVTIAHALAGEVDEVDIAAHLGGAIEAPVAGKSNGANHVGPLKGRQFQEAKRDVLARFERDYFAALADEAKGNVSEMARRAGMERAHVRAYLRRHGIGAKH